MRVESTKTGDQWPSKVYSEIARKGAPRRCRPTGGVSERTHAWMNAYGTLRRCTDRDGKIVDFTSPPPSSPSVHSSARRNPVPLTDQAHHRRPNDPVHGLFKSFGRLKVLKGIDEELSPGEPLLVQVADVGEQATRVQPAESGRDRGARAGVSGFQVRSLPSGPQRPRPGWCAYRAATATRPEDSLHARLNPVASAGRQRARTRRTLAALTTFFGRVS